jgi:hypothetical protein
MGFRFFGLGSNNSVIFLSCIFIMSDLRTLTGTGNGQKLFAPIIP